MILCRRPRRLSISELFIAHGSNVRSGHEPYATSALVLFDDAACDWMEIDFHPLAGLIETVDLVAITLGHFENLGLIAEARHLRLHIAFADPFVFRLGGALRLRQCRSAKDCD